ncbi:ricin-type beta-trefoil lectin domain protein [Streptomyces sp. NPDC058620]|uniref:ricin-type beta-trefoil lectin domain protein n=1 Tax=Streptomyces sp. NPDC058620 TaxID=3346560 RepID=UPI00365E4858
MTRSSQQPPASPRARAESASGGEEPAVTSTPETAAATAVLGEPKSEPAEAKTGAEAGKAATGAPGAPGAEKESGEAEEESGEAEEGTGGGGTTEPETASEPGTEPVSSSGVRSEPEADPGATAAAQSRLPAFVRTMTATAIGRPQQQAGPVGRPGRTVLAGAAIAGALLVSVPFLVLAGNDDEGPEPPSVTAAGTVLDGSAQEAPGEFAVTPPETGAPDDGKKKDTDEPVAEKPARQAPPSVPAPAPDTAKDAPKKAAVPKDQPEKQSVEKESGGAAKPPAVKAAPAVTLSAPVSLRSHFSGRCIDVPAHDFSDGKALFVWDCNNGEAQKWQFASDGTIRIKGKCLDVANANFRDGTPIQIAWCNGNAAQKFVLNPSHDLVNTVVGMCVDIKDGNRGSGAWLQLWTCTGADNQKWSV